MNFRYRKVGSRASKTSLIILVTMIAVSSDVVAAGKRYAAVSRKAGATPWATFPSSRTSTRVPGKLEYPNITFTSHTLPHWDGLQAGTAGAGARQRPRQANTSTPNLSSPQIVSPRDSASGLPTGKLRQ